MSKPIRVFTSKFNEPWAQEEFNRLIRLVPEELHESIMKYDDWELRQGSLARKLLLIHGLKQFGLDIDQILTRVLFTEKGKPYLDGGPHFTLANDGNCAVAALCSDSVLGIDLERIKPINLSDYQAQMTYLEWREIYSHVIPLRRFYEFWTIKESVIKADGERETALKDIYIQPNVAFCHATYWYIHPVEVDYGYVCFLVCSDPHMDIELEEVDLLKEF